MNKFQEKSNVTTSPRVKAIALAVAGCFSVQVLPVYANPQGPTVVAGQAVFQQAGNTLTVTNSPGAIINWQQFNIDRGEITRFIQQSASSQVLNRVTGGDPSQILGMLQSNGRVFLINPNGISFGAGAQVDVAGLLVSTLNLSNQDFLANRLRFDGNGGAVVNQGQIKTAQGGQVLIIAPKIENSGVIQAPDGSILLAAGSSVEISEPGRTDILVQITNQENQAVNLGTLLARSVSLSAGLVKQAGVIEASSASIGEDGKIVLRAAQSLETTVSSSTRADGGRGGQIQIEAGEQASLSGALSASGSEGKGGKITATAPVLTVAAADIRADGRDGGGEVLLGGDWQGGGSLKHATTLSVDAGSWVSADAGEHGNGGKLVFWSDRQTSFLGFAGARGGTGSGNGGAIEISSHDLLNYRGNVDTKARSGNGNNGLILFDPKDIVINSGGGGNLTTENEFLENPGATSTFSASQISSALAGGSVILQATNDVTVDAAIGTTSSPAHTLTMQAGRSIVLNADINTGGANLYLKANDSSVAAGRDPGAAAISSGAGTSITTGGGAFTAIVDSNGPVGQLAALGTSSILLQTINTSGGGGVASGAVQINSAGGDVSVGSIFAHGNNPGVPGGQGQSGGNVTIAAAAGNLSFSGVIQAYGHDGASGDSVSSGAAGGNGGVVNLSASGAMSFASGSDVKAYGGSGGAAAPSYGYSGGAGGSAGAVTLVAGNGISLNNSQVLAYGGTGGANDGASPASLGGAGGNGGSIIVEITNPVQTLDFSGPNAGFSSYGGDGGGATVAGIGGAGGQAGDITLQFSNGDGAVGVSTWTVLNAARGNGGLGFSGAASGGDGSPGAINISASGNLGFVGSGGYTFGVNSSDAFSTISGGGDLVFTDVSLTWHSPLRLLANNDLKQDANSSFYSQMGAVGPSVLLRAGRSILLDGDIHSQGGSLTLVANETNAAGVNPAKRLAGAASITHTGSYLRTVYEPDGEEGNGGALTVLLKDGAGRAGAAAATGDVTLGAIETYGGPLSFVAAAGSGGSITVQAHDANINLTSIDARGGAGTEAFQNGGAGGSVSVSIVGGTAARTITASGSVQTMGGGGYSDFAGGSKGHGGAGGLTTLQISGVGGDQIQMATVDTTGGPGGNVYMGTGGDGGAGGGVMTRFLAGSSGTVLGGTFHTGGGSAGTFSMSGTDGNVGSAANLTLRSDTGNLVADGVTAVGGGAVLQTPAGQVLSGASAIDVTASSVSFSTANGIGTSPNPFVVSSGASIGFSNAASDVYIQSSGAMTVASASTSGGNIVLNAGGNLEISAAATIQSTSGDIALATAGSFVNNRGSDALDASSGRWLVYSQNPVNDTVGGLVRDFTEYNITFPSAPVGIGNGMLYSLAPVATPSFVATSIDKVYDKTTTAPVVLADLNVTGTFPQSEPGMNDTVSLVLGTANYATSNAGSGIAVNVAGLGVSAVDGNGKPVYGYQLSTSSLSSNIGNITPAAITLSTTNVTKLFDGNTSAAGTPTVVSGTLYGSDSVSGGTYTFDTHYVGAGKTVTAAGVTVSDGNGGGNYIVSYASNTNSTIQADPSNFVWTGPSTGGAWNLASSWNQGVLPVNGAAVSGAGLTGPLDFGSGTLTLASLSLPAGFSMTGGTLTVGGASSVTGPFLLSGGTFGIASGGTLTVPSGVTQSGGVFNLGGSSSSLLGNLNLAGGALTGSGTISGNVVVGNGVVSPGASPGTLNITGNLNLSSGSTVHIEVGGPSAGLDYDVINVGGVATLDGTLNVTSWNGYIPQTGINHQFLNFNASSGAFASTNLLNGLSLSFQPTYGELIGMTPFGFGGGGSGNSGESSVIVATLTSAMIDEDGTLQLVLGSPNNEDEQGNTLPTCP